MWIIYKAVSPSKKVYIGITSYKLYERIKLHFNYAKQNNKCKFQKALNKYKNKMKFSIIEKASSFIKAQNKERYWIKFFDSYKMGYNSTLGGEGKTTFSNKEILLIAKKHKTKGNWINDNKSSYNIAKQRGLFKQCIKHMVPKIKYTKELILKEALNYKYIKDWKRKNRATYDAASRYKLLPIATKHMIRLKRNSS